MHVRCTTPLPLSKLTWGTKSIRSLEVRWLRHGQACACCTEEETFTTLCFLFYGILPPFEPQDTTQSTNGLSVDHGSELEVSFAAKGSRGWGTGGHGNGLDANSLPLSRHFFLSN